MDPLGQISFPREEAVRRLNPVTEGVRARPADRARREWITITGLSASTARGDIYAFIFDQKGLVAGIELQGSKITKIEK